jgi:mannitol 2-dehydrogenase
MTNPATGAIKLNQSNLKHLSPEVRVPSYDRSRLAQSIVHVGVGGFHRGHQAVYLDDLLHEPGSTEWGICGVGLLKHDDRMRDVMAAQDRLYTVCERSAQGESARVIGSLAAFLYAPGDPQAVIEKMASPECRIVSLTITEGGYYINEGTGEFDDTHPDIQHDLAHPKEPLCSFGYLAEALDRRRARGLAPFTVMSCDNLQGNGHVAQRMLSAFVERRDPALARWLSEHGAFPNSMVDRIVPATTDEHRALVRERFGIDDGWPVMTEPFKQWVIEDHFVSGRPAWEQVGAQMTADVMPYEKMKIRLLNASHQAMCYIGMLLGYQFAHETMEDPQIRRLVQTMMDVEVTPILPPVPGIDLTQYKRTLIERFANPAIRDQLSRIGTEGSARVPKFVLPSVLDQLPRGGPVKLLSFTVAAWFRYLTGSDDQGRAMPIIDPQKDKLVEHAKRGGANPATMLSLHQLFGDVLPTAPAFRDEVARALASFYEKGARATLTAYVGA